MIFENSVYEYDYSSDETETVPEVPPKVSVLHISHPTAHIMYPCLQLQRLKSGTIFLRQVIIYFVGKLATSW